MLDRIIYIKRERGNHVVGVNICGRMDKKFHLKLLLDQSEKLLKCPDAIEEGIWHQSNKKQLSGSWATDYYVKSCSIKCVA